MLRLYNNSFQVSYRTVRTVQLVMFILLLRTWHFLHVSPTYATSAYKPWISGQQLGSTLPLEFRPLCQVESASNRTNHLASFSSLSFFFQKFKTLISHQFWGRFFRELVITYFSLYKRYRLSNAMRFVEGPKDSTADFISAQDSCISGICNQ